MFTPRKLFFAGFLLSLSMLLIAGYFQFVEHLEPCPLCILQRVATFVAGIWFLLAAVHNPAAVGRRIYALLILITTLFGAATSARHVWLQSLPPDQVPSCGPGLSFMLKNFPPDETLKLLLRGSGECADVVWRFLGLSIPGWTLVAFIVMIVIALRQLFYSDKREWI